MTTIRTKRPRPRGRRLSPRLTLLLLLGLGIIVFLLVRADAPPRNTHNLCAIFGQKRAWYHSTRHSFETWGVPEAVQMAVLYQESGFRSTARPPRRKIWWILPGPRPTTAFGFAQALDATWAEFQRRAGRPDARRHRFDDAAWFVGWYGNEIERLTGIAKDDAKNLYLAYHEGPTGFNRGTYGQKAWLVEVAKRVERRAIRYQAQYDDCVKYLRWREIWGVWLSALGIVALFVLVAWYWRSKPRWR